MTGKAVDIVLISCPNRNIDYPGLAIPALAGALRARGFGCQAIDMNVLIRDRMITVDVMEALKYQVLPFIGRTLHSHSLMQARSQSLINSLNYYSSHGISIPAIQLAKERMQKREYDELLASKEGFDACLAVFEVSRCLNNILELYLACPWMFTAVGVEDPVEYELTHCLRCIAESRPSVIGFSVLDIQRAFSMFVAHRIRSVFDTPIVIGGPDPTKFAPDYLNNYAQVDYVIVREAENTLPMFIQLNAERQDAIRCVPNLYYRDGNTISHSQLRYQSPQLCTSAHYPILPLERYLIPAVPIQASRGCDWARCNFCVHWQTYGQHIERSAEAIIEDISIARNECGIKLFHFTDDAMPVDLGTDISQRLSSSFPDVRWLSYARFDSAFSKQILQDWYAGGCRVLEWGFESASQDLLNLMNKGIKLDTMTANINEAASAGILNKLFAFHGYPGESVSDLAHTLEILAQMAREGIIRLFFPVKNRFELLCGSPIFDIALVDTSIAGKIRLPRGIFSIRAEMTKMDNSVLRQKTKLIADFASEMKELRLNDRVFLTDDENVTLDLQVIELLEQGAVPWCTSIRLSRSRKGANHVGRFSPISTSR